MSAVDVIVPVWNAARWIDRCLQAVAAQTLRPARVIVVDDASDDRSGERLQRWSGDVELLHRSRRGGFARAVTDGLSRSDAPLVALLNVDTEAAPDWLERLTTALLEAGEVYASAASAMVQLDDPHLTDNAGDAFSRYGSAIKSGHGEPFARWRQPWEPTSASAGAALYRRSALDDAGGFDLDFGSYLEDVDLGLRLRALGYRCLYVPSAVVAHAGGGSRLPRRRYVRHVTANRAATVLKNLPASLLLRHAPFLLWGQLYYLIAYRRPLASLAGYLDLVRRLPTVLASRRVLRSRRVLDAAAFDRLLDRRLGEPTLRQLARRWVAR